MSLHPAQNRQLRETYAWARQIAEYWARLAERIGEPEAAPFRQGAEKAGELAEALVPVCEAQGLPIANAAAGAGRSLAKAKGSVRDKLLERNQAIRLAVEEMQHLTTALAYGAALAEAAGTEELATFQATWERKLRRVESAARKAAIEQGARPDAAIEPLESAAGAKVGAALGAIGEWTDAQVTKRRG
ncbi:MAG: hypothetical protein H0V29_11460 [Thermoleophilaceae bacterium]|nr:hypothetical protein [Thermoleophilaceae bacterium]